MHDFCAAGRQYFDDQRSLLDDLLIHAKNLTNKLPIHSKDLMNNGCMSVGTSLRSLEPRVPSFLATFWMSKACRSQAIEPFKIDVTTKTVKKSPQARLSFLGLTKSMLNMAAVKRSGNATYWSGFQSIYITCGGWQFVLSDLRRSFESVF